MKRRTILVIAAGPLQVPAYETARRLGLRSVAVDRNGSAPGMALADVAYAIDTRDVAAIVDIARRERVDGVMTLCTDAPVVCVAAVGHALGLRTITPDAASRATNKVLMRNALARAGVRIPRYRLAATQDEVMEVALELGLPVIVKPPASSGSRGVFKITRPEQVTQAYAHCRSTAGDAGEILVEKFIGGVEVSVETLSVGNRHEVLTITDKRTTGDPHWVETGHVQPSRLSPATREAIQATAIAGLDALGVTDAPGHVEIKVDESGPHLIELGARLGGDFITTELVPRSTGIDMVAAAIQLAMGDAPERSHRHERGAAIRYLFPRPGFVEAIDGVDAASTMPGVVRVEVTLEPGSRFGGVRSSLDRAGYVIVEGAEAEEAEQRADAAARRIAFRMKPV